MKKEIMECDINVNNKAYSHSQNITTRKVPVMFDYDQEDGRSKVTPYFEFHELELCDSCFKKITETRTLIYAYGAMGYNEYYLS